MPIEQTRTDILILGSGGAGLFAAIHARKTQPALDITLAVKGLFGKCGCTRMVQGGYNVAVAPGDSVERHFTDTIRGGAWLSDQDLAWILVSEAADRIFELENDLGCFFDRNPDGSIHLKPFAGQTFDRTVHKGDLTGIEIVNRLAERVRALGVSTLEEHRAVALVPAADGERVAGGLLLDIRDGNFRFVQAKAVLLATGGGPTMYRYHTPSGDKSCDGMAMALRSGLALRDMEMVQFHPTGLMAGPHTRITGTIIEEGLRGAGGHLLNSAHERFLARYDERAERATRDVVSRAMFEEMRAGRTGPGGGLFFTMRHLDADMVRTRFKGMAERCADWGFDLVGGLVDVVPTAHYMMGGIIFAPDCRTGIDGLFAAGEDTGGVHGANRLGGNGVANACVFGAIAGRSIASWVGAEGTFANPDPAVIEAEMDRCLAPLIREPADPYALRERLGEIMWEDVGIVRERARLMSARSALEDLDLQLAASGVVGRDPAFNPSWQARLDLENLVLVSRAIAEAALARENSRGAHYREDFPEPGVLGDSRYTVTRLVDDGMMVASEPVRFSRLKPDAAREGAGGHGNEGDANP